MESMHVGMGMGMGMGLAKLARDFSPQPVSYSKSNEHKPQESPVEIPTMHVGAPPPSMQPPTMDVGDLRSASLASNPLFNAHELASHKTGNRNVPPPPSFGSHSKMMVGAHDIGNVKLKKSSGPKKIHVQNSSSGTVDFRAVLRKSVSKPHVQKEEVDNNNHTVDWRSQMKQRKKPSQSMPPKQLSQDFDEIEDQKQDEGNHLGDSAPKMPPPNPIEVMSAEQRQRQKENTMILDVFADFDENMAQFDEEIENKQNFAENIVSVVQELAGNNKVISGAKHAKKIDAKCKLVVDAAKHYAEALQKFNAMMETLYSEMEDDMEKDQNSDHTLVTAGGALAVDSDVPSGLPANTLNYKYSGADDSGSPVISQNAQPGLDIKAVGGLAALPRYRSVQDVAKANEPDKKV